MSSGGLTAALAALASRLDQTDIVIACSGGRDSVVLAHAAAHAFARERLHLVYVHHGLQAAADAQAQHVLDLAQALGVQGHVRRIDCSRTARVGLEAAAREQRYAALIEIARSLSGQRTGPRSEAAILTAHHAGDQAESVLLAALRGAGPRGLAGIAPEHVLTESKDAVAVRLIRPWVEQPSRMLAEYAAHHGLRWVEDPSNADLQRRRNAVRHRVMPVMTSAMTEVGDHDAETAASSDRLEHALVRVAAWQRQAAADEREWLDALCAAVVDERGALDRQVFRRLPEARHERVLMTYLARFGAALGRAARHDVIAHLRAPAAQGSSGRTGVRRWHLRPDPARAGTRSADDDLWLWVERDAGWVLPAAWVGATGDQTSVRPRSDAAGQGGDALRGWARLPLWVRWYAVVPGDPPSPLVLRLPWTHAGPLEAWREHAGFDALRIESPGPQDDR